MPKLKAIVFDLDGTLTESKQRLETSMGLRIAKLLEQLPVAIFSGAAFHQFEKQVLPFLPETAKKENLHLFPTSAAQCFSFSDGSWRVRYHNDFTSEEKKLIRRALDEGITTTGVIDASTPRFGERIEDRGSQISFSALGQEAPVALKKVWDPDRTKRQPLWQFLTDALPAFHIALNASNTIDITKKGINKKYGIGRLQELLGLDVADMLYVGDALFPGGNDAMVKETGIPTRAVSDPSETARFIEELSAMFE